MKQIFLIIGAAGLFLASCNSGSKTAADTGSATITGSDSAVAPKMKFDHDNHDFGKITEGDKVNYKFSFINTGKTPLIINNAVASCGCTTPDWPKGPIKPGAGGDINITYNSAGKKGLQDKMITITANTNPRQNVVHLIGEVLEKK